MGRIDKEREFQERLKTRWYQWEFLRRNPEYKQDYDTFMAKFGAWFKNRGFWYQVQRGEYTSRDFLFYYNEIWPALQEICAKWCISDPFPTEWTFDERGYHAYTPRRRVFLPTGYTSQEARLLWSIGGPVELVSGGRGDAFVERFRLRSAKQRKAQDQHGVPSEQLLLLKIDAARPDKELFSEIKTAIRLHRDKLSRTGSFSLLKKRTRRRLDQYSLYIRVWDLRQSGLSIREIAREVYPELYRQYPARKNPINQRVLDIFTALKLSFTAATKN